MFKEMNKYMARIIFDKKFKDFEGTKEEKAMAVKKLETDFRQKVSLEGLYDLHDKVDSNYKELVSEN